MEEGIKVLVAFDGSKESRNAVSEAADIANRFHGSVTVLNVYWDPVATRHEPMVERVEGASIGDQGSIRLLEDAEPILKEKKAEYSLRPERDSNVPKTILRIAEADGYGCIALGSRGMGGARAWLLGSVSSKVIAEAPCPVIVA
ncbi:hypothetical protein A3K81_00035 [Candidatus Bathyarchaeota archaeon RBG_13_60_20]|jgi:nucleotide-binding universal stress UspA family protein|nr:MAG: hypothetical protein A3K81_00035 [Candidatus Bathyarchaeota archaeon RBG_13_60_20]